MRMISRQEWLPLGHFLNRRYSVDSEKKGVASDY